VEVKVIDVQVGTYRGLNVEAKDETSYINGLINQIIANSFYVLDEEDVANNADRIEQELKIRLEKEKKSVGAFCYLNGIIEDELNEYCADEYARGKVEDSILLTIARLESITVNETDIILQKAQRIVSNDKIVFNDELDEESIHMAVLTKKILQFLMAENTWVHV